MSEDPMRELYFALAEADAEAFPPDLRARALATAVASRAPGRAVPAAEHITGADAFRRAVDSLDAVLGALDPEDWARPTIRDLDVQGLVGHLIGVETAFLASLRGEPTDAAVDHIESTQPAARAQAGRAPALTHRDWVELARRTLADMAGREPRADATFYGLTLPLDQLLVVRAFEMWIPEADLRRATGRPLADPDPARLARMTDLAVALLPGGMALAGRTPTSRTARLVLTGPGGGTWSVRLDGSQPATAGRPVSDARIVVDAAAFCRVVGDRDDLVGTGAIVDGDGALAADLFSAAAALALD